MEELEAQMAGLQLELQSYQSGQDPVQPQTDPEPLVEPAENMAGTAHSLLRSFILVACSLISVARYSCCLLIDYCSSSHRGGNITSRGGAKAK